MKVYIVIAETLGTDGEFGSDVYLEKSGQSAGELASSLVADMCEEMGIEDVDPTAVWEIGNDYWTYRVRVEEQEI